MSSRIYPAAANAVKPHSESLNAPEDYYIANFRLKDNYVCIVVFHHSYRAKLFASSPCKVLVESPANNHPSNLTCPRANLVEFRIPQQPSSRYLIHVAHSAH